MVGAFFTDLGDSINRATKGRDLEDPFNGMEMQSRQDDDINKERPLDVIVSSIYESAKRLVPRGEAIQRHHLLHNTFMSYYQCEFKDPCPHIVRWVLTDSELAEYIHHSGRGNSRFHIGLIKHTYGGIIQYPEITVDTALDEIDKLRKMYMKIDQPDNNDDDNNNNNISEDGEGILLMFDEDVPVDKCEELQENQTSPVLVIDRDGDESTHHIYKEVVYMMGGDGGVPSRFEFFYNMAYSYSPVHAYTRNGDEKLWWVFERHAYSIFLRQFRPYDRIMTKYGMCYVYRDSTIQTVVDEIYSLCQIAGLDVK